jgi:4-cresol dehydrogenase (hydroxylating) flavoprotein subunit
MGEATAVKLAIAEWTELLGADHVYVDEAHVEPYLRAACGGCRRIPAILRPESTDEVLALVAIANRYLVPLYPVSCGKQWGMGSRLPVEEDCVVVDLGRMNRILEISESFHYAVVEPGVTQRQLIDAIGARGLKLRLNVTGSSSGTSLIGNAMDRGVGYFDSRAHGISNMEVVLGNGQCIKTGFGHIDGAKTANLYRYGIGPSLDGLFPQGNFGIVTAACIDLMPEPEDHLSAIIKVDAEEKLAEVINRLVELRSKGIISTVAHIGNRERSFITMAPLVYEQLVAAGEAPGEATRARAVRLLEEGGFGPWSAAIGLMGTKAQLRLAKRAIKKAFKGLAETMFLDDRLVERAKALSAKLSFIPFVRTQRMLLLAIEPIYGFTSGKTTDLSLKAVYWSAGDFDHLDELDPDQSDSGLLFCLPIIPADGGIVQRVVSETRDLFARHGFTAAITVNLMDCKAMEGVVSLAFDRRDVERTKAAQACIEEMEGWYMAMGYPPYRVGINSMHQVVRPDDSYWLTVRDLKKVLDPNGIIAPGRYNLI